MVSCKVWHLVPWLAEQDGWGSTQSRPCSVGQLGSHEWHRVAFYQAPLRWIHADPHHYWSASTVIDLPNSVSNEAFSEPKTDASLAIVESNSEAGDSSVKGIMDHYCLVQGTWHGCSIQLESREFWLHAVFFGPNKIYATSPGSNMKSIQIKM